MSCVIRLNWLPPAFGRTLNWHISCHISHHDAPSFLTVAGSLQVVFVKDSCTTVRHSVYTAVASACAMATDSVANSSSSSSSSRLALIPMVVIVW